jgi:hypothetical protein
MRFEPNTGGRNGHADALPDAGDERRQQRGAAAESSPEERDVGQHVVYLTRLDGGQQRLDTIAAHVKIGHAAASHGEQDRVLRVPRRLQRRVGGRSRCSK